MVPLLWKTAWFFKKLNIELFYPHYPAIPLPDIYPQKLKAGTKTDKYAPILHYLQQPKGRNLTIGNQQKNG
jgi:hypothetical protein